MNMQDSNLHMALFYQCLFTNILLHETINICVNLTFYIKKERELYANTAS